MCIYCNYYNISSISVLIIYYLKVTQTCKKLYELHGEPTGVGGAGRGRGLEERGKVTEGTGRRGEVLAQPGEGGREAVPVSWKKRVPACH